MTINCNGNLIDLHIPKVMGILNITPDSFYDGGKYESEEAIIFQVQKMLDDGATFIDIGGYSSRPNANHIHEDDELKRVLPVIELLVKTFPNIIISIDTFRSKVAQEAIRAGARIINDISGGNMDENMFKTVADLQVPYIMMHMQGTPQNMQNNPSYNDIMVEINGYFSKKIDQLNALGVHDIILDAGFGFGKTLEQNYTILKNHDLIGFGSFPTLVGISRKSMIYNPLNITAQEALNGTTVLNTLALQKGASILRVHDVKEAVQAIQLISLLK